MNLKLAVSSLRHAIADQNLHFAARNYILNCNLLYKSNYILIINREQYKQGKKNTLRDTFWSVMNKQTMCAPFLSLAKAQN